MVRSMYSGVAGMKVQQTRMDVIGNNISNVGTFGYKSGRATFRDVYYQTNLGATAPTGAIGGRNAMEIGVGSKMGSIDINHSQSVMTTTGYTLDVAIAGEGYLQVEDRSGNVFYTKAGMLDIDADGNLVDVNGNFVLGVNGDPYIQGPSSNRITIKLPNADASIASVAEPVNGKTITISSSQKSELANVVINFQAVNNLPLNSRAKAVASSGSLVIQLNQNEVFYAKPGDDTLVPPVAPTTWLDELTAVINDAVKEAYGGESPLGDIIINIDDPVVLAKAQYKASDITSVDYSYSSGGIGIVEKVKNPNATDANDAYLDVDGNPIDEDGAATYLTYKAGTSLPAAWGALDFSVASTGSDFGRAWGNDLSDEGLNRKASDVIMGIGLADLNSDGIYDGKDDGITFSYFVVDPNGPETEYVVGADIDTGEPITQTANGWWYTATQARESLTMGGTVVLKINDPTGAVKPTESDSITIKFPKFDKMQNGITAGGISDWNKYLVDSRTGETGWDIDKDGTYGDDLSYSFKAVASDPARALGFSSIPFVLKGGTEGGPQDASDLTAININDRGIFSGVHATLGYLEFGRIDLATFANPAGLTQVGNTYFASSRNSGDPKISMAGSDGVGALASSTLETSNVDLSNEFSDMILTQRGFQANSRIITVSDGMIEELVNLKRN
ncbi:hypothetical protein FACS1894132_01160 [Clostridia bacterium]|nr:hypothetical protein FACS1894132_01160 [Clostridia bacterium]